MPTTRIKSPGNLKLPAECRSETPIQPLNIGLGTLICQSKFTFFIPHGCALWDWKQANTRSLVRITIDPAPTCSPPVVGTLNSAWKTPGTQDMDACARQCALLLPITPCRGSMRWLWTIHSRLLSFKIWRKVACVQTCTIFPFVKWETSAHRLGAGSYYICLRFLRCSDPVSRRTIIIKTRFFLLWLF